MSSLAQGNITPQTPLPVDAYSVAAGTALNVSTQTVVKASPGRLVRVDVTVAGTTAGSVNDTATIAGIATSNLVATMPNAIGITSLDFPCANGITFTPGSGMTASIAYY